MSSPRLQAGTQFFSQRRDTSSRFAGVKQPAVYILAGKPNGTLYVGVTSDLSSRVQAHRSGSVEGFTRRYEIDTLVYVELHESMYDAIQREKRIKRWNRAWKIRLIEKENPLWSDLAEKVI